MEENKKPHVADLIHENGTMCLKNGDFVINESDQQHIGDIFTLHKGELKEFPNLGFGASKYLKSMVSKTEFKRNLKVELQKDGYNANVKINTQTGEWNVEII